MPELPEVETIVRGLSAKLPGLTFSEVALTGHSIFPESPRDFCTRLSGARVQGISRHGKAIFISLQKTGSPKTLTLRIHLGMTGQLLWLPKEFKIESHTHVVFHLDHSTHDLRYRDIRRFGEMSILKEGEIVHSVPDAWLSSDKEVEACLAQIRGMLKHALLSQKIVAGLGNIYVDEALFLAKLHPEKTGERLKPEQRKLLTKSIRNVLKRSIGLGGTSFSNYVDINGGRGGFKGRLLVYGKTGLPCETCGTKIRRLVVAGRGTHICPHCQPSPR